MEARGYSRVVKLTGKVADGADRLCPQTPDIVAEVHAAVPAR